ncbi:MAG TPA: ECF-type sigma factor [Bryobacteraceae bacterium]|nr:ECF-type sigma factor [Bryobacteraceae bacterium]
MIGDFQAEYDELRALAAQFMRRHPEASTLQATALVHEVYLKLAQSAREYQDRTHLLCTAATAMRQILVDHARARRRLKRGGDVMVVTLDGTELAMSDCLDVLILNDALERLASWDERQARIVELRFFVGMSVAEAAEALAVSEKTVAREWAMARAWLQRELRPAQETP